MPKIVFPEFTYKGYTIKEMGALAACATLAVVFIGLFVLTVVPFSDSRMLTLGSLNITPEKQIGGERFEQLESFTVSGSIRNLSTLPRPMPNMRVHALDRSGHIAYTRNIESNDQMIAGAGTIDFSVGNLVRPDASVTRFVVELGTRRELLVRPYGNIPDA